MTLTPGDVIVTGTPVKLTPRGGEPAWLKPGDVIISNDAYLGGGNHQPDVQFTRPVFLDGKIVAYTMTRGHWQDIGGILPFCPQEDGRITIEVKPKATTKGTFRVQLFSKPITPSCSGVWRRPSASTNRFTPYGWGSTPSTPARRRPSRWTRRSATSTTRTSRR